MELMLQNVVTRNAESRRPPLSWFLLAVIVPLALPAFGSDGDIPRECPSLALELIDDQIAQGQPLVLDIRVYNPTGQPMHVVEISDTQLTVEIDGPRGLTELEPASVTYIAPMAQYLAPGHDVYWSRTVSRHHSDFEPADAFDATGEYRVRVVLTRYCPGRGGRELTRIRSEERVLTVREATRTERRVAALLGQRSRLPSPTSHTDAGDFEEWADETRSAVESLAPTSSWARYLRRELGLAYADRGDFSSAVEFLEGIADDATTRYNFLTMWTQSKCWSQLGRNDEARASLDRLVTTFSQLDRYAGDKLGELTISSELLDRYAKAKQTLELLDRSGRE